ncbi:methionine S-methyltransferase-like isoform X2 [Malus sylvestris]|uniref:methionine S-methyltransferase-like isoform X2 n=1 Tax=Malus sylvestris TaxID=3752 RepID=UPI0021ABB973|nr:methionine S-methyltransferase-like isoform X2 [Malus sylvestris]
MAKNEASLESVDDFLKRCRQSGDAAYAALRSVLERLEDPKTRTQARIFLTDLQNRFPSKESCDQCFRTYHFQIEDIFFDQYEGYQDIPILSSRTSQLLSLVVEMVGFHCHC